MDFSQEELVEAIDRLVAGLLERSGVTAPPVNAGTRYLTKTQPANAMSIKAFVSSAATNKLDAFV